MSKNSANLFIIAAKKLSNWWELAITFHKNGNQFISKMVLVMYLAATLMTSF